MPIIKVQDIAYVRFAAPDLSEMRSFLEDFGMICFEGDDGRLYARGHGSLPFLHSTEQGEPGFRGLGFLAESIADLEKLAAFERVAVEDFKAPGGGKVVRMTDPNGFPIEVVAGQVLREVDAVPLDLARNTATARSRESATIRLEPGPSHVIRLGHCVLGVADFQISEAWYKERLGFITSDEIEATPGVSLGAFLRCDRGDTPTDHHTVFLAQLPTGIAYQHAAYEVANIDDLMLGHTHLDAASRMLSWGVGRHKLGSQVFDYWKDPWGHELEHWTDGDLFTAADGSNMATMADLIAVQWGTPHTAFSGKFVPGPKVIGFFLALQIRFKRLFRRAPKGIPA